LGAAGNGMSEYLSRKNPATANAAQARAAHPKRNTSGMSVTVGTNKASAKNTVSQNVLFGIPNITR
jgi:hypothetical protein